MLDGTNSPFLTPVLPLLIAVRRRRRGRSRRADVRGHTAAEPAAEGRGARVGLSGEGTRTVEAVGDGAETHEGLELGRGEVAELVHLEREGGGGLALGALVVGSDVGQVSLESVVTTEELGRRVGLGEGRDEVGEHCLGGELAEVVGGRGGREEESRGS